MIENRNRLILELIIKNGSKFNFLELSKKLEITEKTLNTDIKKINQFLKIYESELIIKNKYILLNSMYGKIDWINILKINSNISDADRIMVTLLLEKNTITIGEIAENTYLSRSKVEKILKSFDIKPLTWNNKRNSGLNICGSDLMKLILCIDILESYVDDLNYIVTTKLVIQKIFNIYIDSKEFEKIVNLHYSYLDKYERMNEIKVKKLFILLTISNLFDYDYEQNYADYVQKFTFNADTNNILKKDINEVLTINNINYDVNNITYIQLYEHLNKLINHFEVREAIKLDTNLESRFTYAYQISKQILNKYNIKDVNELELVTIYIQTLIDKTKIKTSYIDINIVSQHSNSITEYISTKILDNINLEIKFHRYSISEILNNCEMIGHITITTLSNLELINTFYVNPIPSDEEIIKLCLMIKNKITLLKVNDLIDEKYFSIDFSNDFNHLKNNIYKLIKQNNLVDDGFFESFEERLNMDFSVVNESIFLHGNTNYVLDNKILVFLIKDGIEYQNQKIKIVFVILLTNEYLNSDSKLIKNIYKILMQKESIEILLGSSNVNYLKYSLNSNILIDS